MTLRLSILVMTAALTHAGIVTFTDFASFQAAAGATTTTDFEGLAPAGGTAYFGGTGLLIGGVNINTSDQQLFAVSATFLCQGVVGACSLGTGDMIEGADLSPRSSASTTTFALGANTFVFGLNFRAYDQQPGLPTNADGTFDVSVDGGAPFSITSAAISNFIGIVSTTPLTSVSFTPTGNIPNQASNAEFFHFDNMSVGAGIATPEPGSVLLIGLGLLALCQFRRKS